MALRGPGPEAFPSIRRASHDPAFVVHADGPLWSRLFPPVRSPPPVKFVPLALASALALTLAVAPQAAFAKPPAKAAAKAAQPVTSKGMVAAANPMAVEAGLKVLRAGGTAVDAAVAVQATLGLVEPQSSGLGGGAFMVYYDAKSHKVTAYNGRETAPAGATPDMFLGPDGKPMDRPTAMTSGRSAGVPGAIAMLYLAQQQHGRLKWGELFG